MTEPVRDAFLGDSDLRRQLFKAFMRMAAFYGFDVHYDPSYRFVARSSFSTRASDTWLKFSDHNHQRITRIIRYVLPGIVVGTSD